MDLISLDSIYYFHQNGVYCDINKDKIDKWYEIQHPYYNPEEGICYGFIDVKTYSCKTRPIREVQRLCSCEKLK